MDRRQFLAAAGVGVAATTAGCTGNVLSTDDEPGSGAETGSVTDREITVSAEGDVETDPDEAELSIGVESRGDSSQAATDELAADAEQLRDALEDLEIPEDNVEEGQYRVTPVHNRDDDVEEFRGVRSFDVTLEDTNRVGEVIDAAVEAGADNIGRVNFTLAEETRDDLRTDAIDAALERADNEAEHVATNRGVELTGTNSVTTSDVRVHSVRYDAGQDMLAADDAAATGTEIDADPVSVTASVSVSYGFTDA
ncbi:SIMPL domain-containing protein [Natronolimnobius baerhuensis]|uniref:SIMPL domain-containing protein n=1 Tax=Natronolimnobius baerhuensis TaxID=253108 RepID=A0A202E9B5_9EURY|nr:SIMPL domain-containing protein [Natronolimnobius baerhuensis]OVE84842.1 SIMPL domain-containing protein [Natronolimnobius baerhuensis]